MIAPELHQLVDERLRMVAGGQHVNDGRENRARRDTVQDLTYAVFRRFAQFAALGVAHEPIERDRKITAQALGRLLAIEPRSEPRGEIDALEPAFDDLTNEKVLTDEAREGAADLVLAARHDRGMRDGGAERLAKQSRYGKPVGEAADQSGFGKRPEHVDGGIARAQRAGGCK